ncbi:MAG: bifunctional hydroxymethylpyrimidine kinase/phosphomethylpyrimidine kinase [Lachnospiraceae bacterium]|nr:bifunctional hydroxymethylpyrimidine kinase/phosphomethylpyrimidine kinase [Lachnospiraceae bacterium]
MKKVLTIAGSDSSGGAGIQADLKTMCAHGVYGMSVITAVTAQNTTGISGILNTGAEMIRLQMQAVFDDITPDAVKIGMLPDKDSIELVADVLEKYEARNVVLDPVLVSTTGTKLSKDSNAECMKDKIFGLCTLITPNIPEAEVLMGERIDDKYQIYRALEKLNKSYGTAVLIKGGHSRDTEFSEDYLFDGERFFDLKERRIDNPNTHGTGCTLSSAIACELAKGNTLYEAVLKAKKYLTGCIGAGLDLGKGRGPLDHLYQYNN